MHSSRPPRVILLGIVTATLALTTAGCCRNVPDEEETRSFEGVIADAELMTIRDDADSDEDRCAAACRLLTDRELYGEPDTILDCEAVAAMPPDDPWDPAHTEITVTCTAEFISPGFCTGRRPQGHHEAALTPTSRGSWFAVHAHLERASVTAFRELAGWLRARSAPPALISRCEAAAADEVVHADRIEALARREGATVPPPTADPASDDLFAVALHNAVEGCISEAFAALIAAHQAQHAADPEHRALFTTIAADELRHGQLAWDLHTWLFDQLTPTQQHQLGLAQARALDSLPELARASAAATPSELGWPGPALAATLAAEFAAHIRRESELAAAA